MSLIGINVHIYKCAVFNYYSELFNNINSFNMYFEKAIISIILMSLDYSHSSHVNNSVRTPSGRWNVVAVNGYNSSLPIFKCWTIDISEPSHGSIRGSSSFYDRNTNEYFQVLFRGKRYAGYRDSLIGMHHFELSVTFGENEPLNIRTVSFIYALNDKVTAQVSDFSLEDQSWNYFEKIYMSRSPQLPNDYTVGDAMIIDNLDC